MDITPGATVSVEITATPTNAAARKTLIRLCHKDPRIEHTRRRQTKHRPSWQTWRRGGKQWHHQMKTRSPVKLDPGTKYTVHATLDVVRDLESVERWVKVTTG